MRWPPPMVFSVAVVLLLLAPETSQGQMGTITTRADNARANLPMIAKPNSEVAVAIKEALDREVTLGKIKVQVGRLGEELTQKLGGLPVFVDQRGLKLAELASDMQVKSNVPALPLRAALRYLLKPHSLRAVIENEGLVITVDFTSLVRRGISTDQWVGLEPEFVAATETALNAKFSETFVEMPLEDAVHQIHETTGLQMLIDRRALEEIGLSSDQPVSLSVSGVPLRSFLNMMLRELDLTYMTSDNVVTITTIEAAEQNLQSRMYWLEGTGCAVGDYHSIIDGIQTTVVPDTWESLGGPSTIVPIAAADGNRPAIMVNTTYTVHHKIEAVLETMRSGHAGPDPIAEYQGFGGGSGVLGVVGANGQSGKQGSSGGGAEGGGVKAAGGTF